MLTNKVSSWSKSNSFHFKWMELLGHWFFFILTIPSRHAVKGWMLSNSKNPRQWYRNLVKHWQCRPKGLLRCCTVLCSRCTHWLPTWTFRFVLNLSFQVTLSIIFKMQQLHIASNFAFFRWFSEIKKPFPIIWMFVVGFVWWSIWCLLGNCLNKSLLQSQIDTSSGKVNDESFPCLVSPASLTAPICVLLTRATI